MVRLHGVRISIEAQSAHAASGDPSSAGTRSTLEGVVTNHSKLR